MPVPEASAPFLRRVRDLEGYTVGAADGDVGSVEDVYFDDQSWTVRSVVVDTGTWLPGRKVLISPASLEGVDPVGRRLVSHLTRQQVEDSPSVDLTRPVSRQQEIVAARYYGHPYYWTGPYRWGPLPYPGAGLPLGGAPSVPDRAAEEAAARARESGDPHLRSADAVRGYGIEATDGTLGEVEDFLVDEQDWAIRYLIVDPRRWWPGPHVLLSVEWIEDVSWNDSVVIVNVTRQAVRNAPVYDTSGPLPREFEARLHGHYRRPGYWERPVDAWRLWPPAA